eukprot:s4645_g9.t1
MHWFREAIRQSEARWSMRFTLQQPFKIREQAADEVHDFRIGGDIRITGLLVAKPVKVGLQLPRDSHRRTIKLGLLPYRAICDMADVGGYAQNGSAMFH